MKLREIKDNEVMNNDSNYINKNHRENQYSRFVTRKYRAKIDMVKFKRVFIRRNKKKKTEFYGELVIHNGGVKVLLPIRETLEIDCHNVDMKVRNGLYFMGNEQVSLTNPKGFNLDNNSIMYQIEFVNR